MSPSVFLALLVLFVASVYSIPIEERKAAEFAKFQAPEIKIHKNAGKHRAFAARCGKIPPGMDKIALGVDIAMLDLLPKKAEDAKMGYKRPVFDYTCDEGKTVSIGADEYDLPDQIWDIARFPRGVNVENAIIIKTSREVKTNLGITLGGGLAGELEGAFEGTASFDQDTATLTQKDSNIEEVNTYVSAIRADTIPVFAGKPSRIIALAIKRCPLTYKEGPRKFDTFVKLFGTHYFMTAHFGGIIKMRLETKKDFFKTTSEQKIKADAKGMIENVLRANGGMEHGNTVVDSKFVSATNNQVRFYGGDTNLLASKNSFPDWQPTIHGNPWLYGGEVASLEDFFEEEPYTKTEGFHQAVKVYLARTHANAMRKMGKRHLTMRREFGQTESANAINDLMVQLSDEANRELTEPETIREISKKLQEAFKA